MEASRLSRRALLVGSGRRSARVIADGGASRSGASAEASFAPMWGALFGCPWLVWGSAVLIATLNVFLFAFDRPWTASDGLRNWGDWVLTGAGVIRRPDLLPPWLYSGSLLNVGVIVGGTIAALLSREFAIRVPARAELAKGGAGGLLMGVGAVLAFGCNIGGFFSATSALSLSGLGMMLGLGAGAFLGIRYLIWEVAHRPQWSRGGGRIYLQARGAAATGQPWAGAVVLALVALALVFYTRAGYGPQGVFLLFGAAFGVVFQRSRFCLVRAFREPFMSGDAEHTRAAALALAVSTLGFAILKFTDLKDKSEWVFPAAGVGSLAGGLAFGVGMTLAGGCGAGSLWRAGEGQVKLWVAVACFALGASLARLVAVQTGLLQKLGAAVFLPATLGWGGAILLIVAIAVAWAMLSTWNEETHTFSVV
ncbi:MAG TPA: YeeE/YedE thiosulfate transporter family protein [Methylomirabilota bacterium]|nr:YeeE/YedE thiosulfate transporter family protein [Methylomirabilota bacterium]